MKNVVKEYQRDYLALAAFDAADPALEAAVKAIDARAAALRRQGYTFDAVGCLLTAPDGYRDVAAIRAAHAATRR